MILVLSLNTALDKTLVLGRLARGQRHLPARNLDLAGGKGSIPMAVAGALVIGCLRNGLDLLGVHPFMQNVFIGSIIILIVFLSGLVRRRHELATRGTL